MLCGGGVCFRHVAGYADTVTSHLRLNMRVGALVGKYKRDSRRSLKAALIGTRRLSADLPEGGGKRTRVAEAKGKADLGYRMFSGSQHYLRLLDPLVGMIAMRRNTKRLLERAAEVVRAQPREAGQHRERNLLGKVLVDISGYHPLLPGGEATPHRRFAAGGSAIQSNQFVHQEDAKSFDIETVLGAPRVDRLLQFRGGAPDGRILEKKPRCEGDIRVVPLELGLQFSRVEIEIRYTWQRARIVPFAVFMRRRHEYQFFCHVAQCRSRQALDIGFSVAARAMLVGCQQVHRRAEAVVDPVMARRLDEFGAHAAPLHSTTRDKAVRRDLHRRQ